MQHLASSTEVAPDDHSPQHGGHRRPPAGTHSYCRQYRSAASRSTALVHAAPRGTAASAGALLASPPRGRAACWACIWQAPASRCFVLTYVGKAAAAACPRRGHVGSRPVLFSKRGTAQPSNLCQHIPNTRLMWVNHSTAGGTIRKAEAKKCSSERRETLATVLARRLSLP